MTVPAAEWLRAPPRAKIHRHFGAVLVYDFAPVQIRKRNADWGHAEVNRRFNEAQLAFIRRVGDAREPWMTVEEHAGIEAAQSLIADLHAGRIDPAVGHVVVLS